MKKITRPYFRAYGYRDKNEEMQYIDIDFAKLIGFDEKKIIRVFNFDCRTLELIKE